MKEQQDRLTEDKEKYDTAKQQAEEKVKQVQRQLRDLREEFSDVQKKEMEIESKYKENVSSLQPIEHSYFGFVFSLSEDCMILPFKLVKFCYFFRHTVRWEIFASSNFHGISW